MIIKVLRKNEGRIKERYMIHKQGELSEGCPLDSPVSGTTITNMTMSPKHPRSIRACISCCTHSHSEVKQHSDMAANRDTVTQ
jgi:hypothetical protein